MPIRARVLRWFFERLYDRMSPAHEFVGWCAFGASSDGRRQALFERVEPGDGLVVDVGCGEGRLFDRFLHSGLSYVGVEPSNRMAHRARKRGCSIVRAQAEALPFANERVVTIVCTYPGSWIMDSRSQDEFARVVCPGGSLHVLLGGSYIRGRGAFLRRVASRLVYGSRYASVPVSSFPGFHGAWEVNADRWGDVIVWRGRRDED